MVMNAKLPDDTDYSLSLNLSYPILPDQSTFNIMKTKVEIKMKKCDGIRWNALEGDESVDIKHIPTTSTVAQPPTYPSSAPKRRDWDKIESQIKKEEEEEKEMAGEGAELEEKADIPFSLCDFYFFRFFQQKPFLLHGITI